MSRILDRTIDRTLYGMGVALIASMCVEGFLHNIPDIIGVILLLGGVAITFLASYSLETEGDR